MVISKEKYQQVDHSILNDNILLNGLLDLLVEYSNSQDKDLYDTIKNGLRLIIKPDPFISSSFFMLDKKDYIFKHYHTIPDENKSYILDNYAQMIEDGTIGTALESGSHAIHSNKYYNANKCFIISPLCNSDSVLGLVIIESRKIPMELERAMISFLNLMLSTFRMKLELQMLNMKQRTTTIYLDQLAAEKALKILNK